MTQSKFIRRTIAIIVLTACVISWLTLGASFIFEFPNPVQITTVFAAAVSTEALIWVAAALLGWKAFEKYSFWKRLTGHKSESNA